MVEDITSLQTNSVPIHAQGAKQSDKPDKNGNLIPGQKGYLTQQIEGPVTPFEKTMSDINHKLHRKRTAIREIAYNHDLAARLAADASKAVGNMAHEVSSEANENAESKAAAAAQCAEELQSMTDPAEKGMKAKECEAMLDQKEKAYNEAADAQAASTKAVDAAGARQGEVAGMAGVHADGTSRLVTAENNAIGAKLLLANFVKEQKTDDMIAARRARQKATNRRLIEHANSLEERAQDAFDANVAKEDSAPPPRATRAARLPQEQPDETSRIEVPKLNRAAFNHKPKGL